MIVKFLFFSFLYFLARKFTDNFGARKQVNPLKWICLGVYLVIIIGLQLTDTMSHMEKKCGNMQIDKAMIYTLIPNVLIFGLLIMILIVMPGWKAPFSNTIGYVCVMNQVVNYFFDLFSGGGVDKGLLQRIDADPSMLINEITPGNFDLFFSKLSDDKSLSISYEELGELEKKQNEGERLSAKENAYLDAFIGIYNSVVTKDLVAEGIWYCLVGALVITLTKNAVSEMGCEKDKEQMLEEYNESGGTSKMQSLKA